MPRTLHLLLATALLGIPTASAQEEAAPAAPRPDQASGIARSEGAPPTYELFWIPRALLFVPRWAFWAAMQPVRLGAWAFERYHLDTRFRGSLFSVERTLSIYPTVTLDGAYGLTAGARLVHKDLAGRGERLKLRADLSGRYRRTFGAGLRSGERFGRRFTAELDARYERRPLERFFGIGDGPALDAPPAAPIDPAAGALETQYGEDTWRAVGSGTARLAGPLSARVRSALTRRSFEPARADADDPSIEMVYDTSRLAGWGGVRSLSVEGELAYDSRRPTAAYQSRALDATGWYAGAYLSGVRGLSGDPTAYMRYGAEAVRLLDLYRGSRVLALRVLAESIVLPPRSSSAAPIGGTDGRIAFAELPTLGGSDDLRGYPTSRFRDRALVLGTAEYTWDLGNYLAAYTFVDAGRVLPSLADVSLGDRLRVGYGGGLQVHTRSSFLGRVQLAASRDGDLELELVLTPSFGRRERAGRR